jgi:hypothetical protein
MIRPFKVIIGPAEHQYITAQIITDPSPCFTVGTRHSGLEASLDFLQIYTKPDVGNNVKDDSFDHTVCLQSSDIQVLRSSHHLVRFLVLFSVITGSAIAAVQ